MATSKCPKCDSSFFELKEKGDIQGSNFKFSFIQCASCGAVVGVVDVMHVPTMIQKIKEKLNIF